jgi:hypothetical protein
MLVFRFFSNCLEISVRLLVRFPMERSGFPSVYGGAATSITEPIVNLNAAQPANTVNKRIPKVSIKSKHRGPISGLYFPSATYASPYGGSAEK